jgi:integrase
MPTQKFTEKSVRALPAPDPSGRQVLVWATEPKGFGVLCSGVSKAKTYIVQRALPSGGRRRVTIGPCNVLTLADATAKAKLVLAEFYQGRDPKAARHAKMTLRQALDNYLAARKSLSAATRRNYETNVRLYLKPWLDQPLKAITPDIVEARHRKIQQEVANEHHDGLGTANQAMVVLRLIWNYTADLTPLPPNPVRRLKRQWFEVPRRTGMVKADDMPLFYKAVTELPNPTHRDFLLLLLFTGMRNSEAASLRWDDVDFKGKVIRVPAIRTKTGTKLDLPMSDFVHSLLVIRRAMGREEFIFAADSESGYLHNIRYSRDIIAKATGIDVSAHDLRRTFLTVAESCDISPLALKALVNHSVGRGVTEGYIQMTVERLRFPAQKIADKLTELCGITEAEAANVTKMAARK